MWRLSQKQDSTAPRDGLRRFTVGKKEEAALSQKLFQAGVGHGRRVGERVSEGEKRKKKKQVRGPGDQEALCPEWQRLYCKQKMRGKEEEAQPLGGRNLGKGAG